MPSRLAVMPRLRGRFINEVMAQERGQESYEVPPIELFQGIEHDVVSKDQKAKDEKGKG